MNTSNIASTYDDIQLIPNFSDISSRQEIQLFTQLTTNYNIKVPLIASPMDTVCDHVMAITMAKMGGVGCIHRFMSIEDQSTEVSITSRTVNNRDIVKEWNSTIPVVAAIGANGDYLERARELVKNGANVILIDVAHGHHIFVKNAIEQLKKHMPSHVDIIAGNIATRQAAIDLIRWGADALRVGVGGGSMCLTRIKTGFGIPNVTSLIEVAEVSNVPIIACGGIKNSGDIAKALAVGASSVILGSLLAGTKEAPGLIIEKQNGLYKKYRGAASLETKIAHGQATRNVEGESTVIPFKGGVKFIVDGLLDGLKSALSYAGARNLTEFHPDYIIVSQAGVNEARPHLLY